MHGWLLFVHCVAAPAFAAGLALRAVLWAEHCRIDEHDWEWLTHYGGYLGGRDDLPAELFNAGQKAFFWLIMLLGLSLILSGLGRMFPVLGPLGQAVIYELHRWTALLLVVAFVVHSYLAIFANPGTLQSIVSGSVSEDWAKRHHPLWWERVKERSEENETDD